ncbi:hypothetical protein [Aeoliella sp. SH292]|uniref:hypothetical protein n=1 Tax=Aeoliella sp. SH292 TaxID=3454464 RepID=UPI003F9538FD
MDDQAAKLRQLVSAARYAATVATGPPLLVVYSPARSDESQQFVHRFRNQCGARGIRTADVRSGNSLSSAVDWQVFQVAGEYQSEDFDHWHRASVQIVLTHSDDESVVETYKKLKDVALHTPLPPLELVVFTDDDPPTAFVSAQRLSQTCQRFLLASIAGITLIDGASLSDAAEVSALVERLAMMAPVAERSLNNPIAAHSANEL